MPSSENICRLNDKKYFLLAETEILGENDPV